MFWAFPGRHCAGRRRARFVLNIYSKVRARRLGAVVFGAVLHAVLAAPDLRSGRQRVGQRSTGGAQVIVFCKDVVPVREGL